MQVPDQDVKNAKRLKELLLALNDDVAPGGTSPISESRCPLSHNTTCVAQRRLQILRLNKSIHKREETTLRARKVSCEVYPETAMSSAGLSPIPLRTAPQFLISPS